MAVLAAIQANAGNPYGAAYPPFINIQTTTAGALYAEATYHIDTLNNSNYTLEILDHAVADGTAAPAFKIVFTKGTTSFSCNIQGNHPQIARIRPLLVNLNDGTIIRTEKDASGNCSKLQTSKYSYYLRDKAQ